MRPPFLPAVLILALSALPSLADEMTDRLQAAQTAYEAGDLKTASVELTAASGLLAAKKSALLVAVLPPAPAGWTQTVTEDYAASLAMAGGGTGAEARYDHPNGTSVTIGVIMDSPLMGMMMGMFGNPQMLAMMGKTVQIGDVTLVDQDNSLVTVVDQRIMVTINGAETAKLMPFAEALDYAAMARFDSPN